MRAQEPLNLDSSTRRKLLTTLLKIRMFDEKEFELVASGELRETHSSFGHEAIAAGVCANLRNDDMITSTHRGFSHCIAKGVDLPRMMSELFGKCTGLCSGKGGAFHLADQSVGILGEFPVVGAGLPIAVGAAMSVKFRSGDQVVACFFGDGASNTGVFHEALNFASVLNVPVLFVCENNGWGEILENGMKIREISKRASSYDIQGRTVDGADVESIYLAVQKEISEMRVNKAPYLLEMQNPMPHGSPRRNPKAYAEFVEYRKTHDLVGDYEMKLTAEGTITENEVSLIKKEINEEIARAVKFARDSPLPSPSEALTNIYS
ncbi:MAG: thiamine pyrophosphate-dependent dehydrogenase E1 component subunit alpha [Nitrososphaerales archaeon]